MSGIFFILEVYAIISALVFIMYPKQLWIKNHIVNLTVLILLVFLYLLWGSISINSLYATIVNNHFLSLNKNFLDLVSLAVPEINDKIISIGYIALIHFIVGRLLYTFKIIDLFWFDLLYSGFIPFIIFYLFFGFAFPNLGTVLLHWVTYIIFYGVFMGAIWEVFFKFNLYKIVDSN